MNSLRKKLRDFMKAEHQKMSLEELTLGVINILVMESQEQNKKIAFVSGLIRTNGLDKIAINLKLLNNTTDLIDEADVFLVFSPADVFNLEIINNLDIKGGHNNKRYEEFWEEVLSKSGLRNIFMMPNWTTSEGSIKEYILAKKLGWNIFYLS